MPDYFIPPAHKGFKDIKICGPQEGAFKDAALAEIEPGGDGPLPSHTHSHDHLFIALEGTVTLKIENENILLNPNESYRVPGKLLHSVWNESTQTVKVLGISLSENE